MTMFRLGKWVVLGLAVFLWAAPEAGAIDPTLEAADRLYRAGKFAEAEAGYRVLLNTNSTLVPAQVGLVRAMLRQQKIDEAFDAVNAESAAQPDSAALLASKGDVQFRRAEMAEAELSYLEAKKLDPKEVHARLGLMRLYRSYSLYRKAYDQLRIAHEIAPDDIEVQRAWLSMLPRKERLAAMEAYLAGAHPDDEEETNKMTEYLEFLRATADKPIHACRLVSKVEQTETKLETMYASDSRRMRGLSVSRVKGIGLSVKLNEWNAHLLLDTGAGGIMVSRKVAEKAGLIPISAMHYGGIGDKGLQSGYSAVADHVRIGELEFQDCVVSVIGNAAVADEDGLIGADVFGAYLVDLDLPAMRLGLSPLPPKPARRLPNDRYIAPEMADWTKVFRFGHSLLVPTWVNDYSKSMLFGLDTGASSNILSARAGRQVSKVRSNDRIRMRGLEGEVNKVYSSKKATLRFGNLRQSNLDIITLDLVNISRHTGTEVSGFLGFAMLMLLEVKLDYRDGLVDFIYDPKRANVLVR